MEKKINWIFVNEYGRIVVIGFEFCVVFVYLRQFFNIYIYYYVEWIGVGNYWVFCKYIKNVIKFFIFCVNKLKKVL